MTQPPVGGNNTRNTASPLPKFQRTDEFRRILREKVNRYFAETARRPRDCPAMYLKSAILLLSLAGLYALLVFAPITWPVAIPLTILLGLTTAAIGFNIQHDGSHGAYSEHRWINKLAAMTLDLLGASSYVWARKHNTVHHTYTNVTGYDDDIDVGPLARLTPHQRHLPFHRFQHIYLWFLYGFLPIKWHFLDDFRDVIVGHIGGTPMPRPKGWDLALLLGGKAVFFTLALGIPLLFHPWWAVLAVYAGASIVQGIVLSVVFQLAHCVEETRFPLPDPATHRLADSWAVHQVQTTVDFSQNNHPLTWFVGGLNFQVEHHLFPQICHVHYPAIASIVRQTCAELGLPYVAQPTLRRGILSHYRWLRHMGRAVA